jgi:hypothetical protein
MSKDEGCGNRKNCENCRIFTFCKNGSYNNYFTVPEFDGYEKVAMDCEYAEFLREIILRLSLGCSDDCIRVNVINPFADQYDLSYDEWIKLEENHILFCGFYFSHADIQRIRNLIPNSFFDSSLMDPILEKWLKPLFSENE